MGEWSIFCPLDALEAAHEAAINDDHQPPLAYAELVDKDYFPAALPHWAAPPLSWM